jgi:hypothetical protein
MRYQPLPGLCSYCPGIMTFVDFSQCSTSLSRLGLDGRGDSHLWGLTSIFIAVNGFGDILKVENGKQVKIVEILVRVVDFDIGCARVATLSKGFFRLPCDLRKSRYVSRMKEERNEKGAEAGEELCKGLVGKCDN